jgi:hypothetical protein
MKDRDDADVVNSTPRIHRIEMRTRSVALR